MNSNRTIESLKRFLENPNDTTHNNLASRIVAALLPIGSKDSGVRAMKELFQAQPELRAKIETVMKARAVHMRKHRVAIRKSLMNLDAQFTRIEMEKKKRGEQPPEPYRRKTPPTPKRRPRL